MGPIRNIHVMSENSRNILANVLKAVQPKPEKKVETSSEEKILLKDALASGKFSYVQWGLYKQADSDTSLGKVWQVKDIDGEKWLVSFKDDDDDIIYSIANEQLRKVARVFVEDGDRVVILPKGTLDIPNPDTEFVGKEGVVDYSIVNPNMYPGEESEIGVRFPDGSMLITTVDFLQKVATTAAAKVKPEDIPINQDIKSKNITIDETGGQGTAKVTIEFTDTDKGYKFFQEQGGSAPVKEEAPAEEAPAEEAPAEGEGEAKPKAPAPQPAQGGGAMPNPFVGQGMGGGGNMLEGAGVGAQGGLKPTVQTISKNGEQAVLVIREVMSNIDELRQAHYRDSDNPTARCETCEYFASFGNAGQNAGQCGLFNTRVIPSAICDEFSLHTEGANLTGDTLNFSNIVSLNKQKTAELPGGKRLPQAIAPTPKYRQKSKDIPADTDVLHQKLPTGQDWPDTKPSDLFDDAHLSPVERERRRKQLDRDRAKDFVRERHPEDTGVVDDIGLFEDDEELTASQKTAMDMDTFRNVPPGGLPGDETQQIYDDPDWMEYSSGYNYGYFKAQGRLTPEDEMEYTKFQRSDIFDIAAEDGSRDAQANVPNRYSSQKKEPTLVAQPKVKQKMSLLNYYFVNEDGVRINLPWKNDHRIGSQFIRPDTGKVVRVAGYDTVHFASDYDLAKALMGKFSWEEYNSLEDEDPLLEDQVRCPACGFRGSESDFLNGVTPEELANLVRRCPHCGEQFFADDIFGEEDDFNSVLGVKLFREAAEVGGDDNIPPMSLENSESATPEDTQPLPPNPNLQNDEPTLQNDPSKSNVLYDSQNDQGPQFQTLVNPKDKSVTVKFLDSPEEEELRKALEGPATPPAGGQPPAQGQPGGGMQINPQEEFGEQEIPVQF